MWKTDEVYTYFGAAALGAQCFEQSLCLALIVRRTKDSVALALDDARPATTENVSNSLERKTLGQLIGLFKAAFDVEYNVAAQFARALKLRNRLMHGYFPENARQLSDPEGRAAMVRELDQAKETLYQAHILASTFVSAEGDELRRLMDEGYRRTAPP